MVDVYSKEKRRNQHDGLQLRLKYLSYLSSFCYQKENSVIYSYFLNAVGNQSHQDLEQCLAQSSQLINELVGIYRSILCL